MNPQEPTVPERGAEIEEGTVSALEAVDGLAVAGSQRLSAVRLQAVVAASLRAALDLVLGDQPPRKPLTATWDDGALEITVPDVRLENLTAAGALLESIDGNVGAAREGKAFLMRVPVAGPRALYLMLEQGTLNLAIPWHAVIRIRLVRPDALEQLARREGSVVLPPFVTVPPGGGERPAVLVALGLRRAFLTADRLVWRMPADPIEPPESTPGASLGSAVRTSEGEMFWVADPARLLRGIEPFSPPIPPSIPPPPPWKSAGPIDRSEPAARPPVAPARIDSPFARPIRVAPEPSAARPPAAPSQSRLVELRPEDVEPLRAIPPAEPAPRGRGARRALVVEDSIVGRIFLQRLLEAQGFSVESVSSAAELRHAGLHSWALMFVDVSLPDSPRGEHLRTLAGTPAVALIRDRHDERTAEAAGIRFALRKPFERADLLRVIEALGLAGETA